MSCPSAWIFSDKTYFSGGPCSTSTNLFNYSLFAAAAGQRVAEWRTAGQAAGHAAGYRAASQRAAGQHAASQRSMQHKGGLHNCTNLKILAYLFDK